MMLENTLINPNFAGRDGFKWFIGQIAPNVSNVNEIEEARGGLRCKVRILGYHPSDNRVRDEDLPWAHVLVPPSLGTGEGNYSALGSVQPGSTVFGFFLDGDDGQQPVIVGAFYSGSDIESVLTWNRILSQGTSEFNPFSPSPKKIIPPATTPISPSNENTGADRGASSKDGKVIDSKREKKKTILSEQTEVSGIIIEPILKCETSSGTLSRITNLLRNFIRIANTVKDSINFYVNPVLNQITNIASEIKLIADAIADLIISLLKKVRDRIISIIYKLLKQFLNNLLPANLKSIKELAADQAVKQIWCVFEKVAKKISKFIFDFLFNIFEDIISFPVCAAEAFLGTILGSAVNEITDSIQDTLDEVTSSLNGTIPTVLSILEQVINASASAVTFLSCEENQCTQQYAYELNKGFLPEPGEGFKNVVNFSASQGIRNLSEDAKASISSFLGDIDQTGDCSVTNLNCIIPKVSIFGGGGFGASGESVVNSLGQIIGVNILSGGVGYDSNPLISFDDPCNLGSGVKAVSRINSSGEVEKIIITDPGLNYLGSQSQLDIESNTACDVNPVTENGSEVFGTIDEVIVVEPGFGYTNSDKISDSSCNTDIDLVADVDDEGRIISATIRNPGTAIRVFPELQINSENGQGAVLLPVLKFNNKPSDPTSVKDFAFVETDTTKVNNVVLCGEDNE